VGGERHGTSSLLPGMTRNPLFGRVGGPQGRSEQMRKIPPPALGFDPRTVQPVAIPAHEDGIGVRKFMCLFYWTAWPWRWRCNVR